MSGNVPELERLLDPRLRPRPFPVGDPIPEIWDMLRDLGRPDLLREAAQVVLDAHISVAKLQRQIEGKRIDGLTKLRDVVARGKG